MRPETVANRIAMKKLVILWLVTQGHKRHNKKKAAKIRAMLSAAPAPGEGR